MLIGQFYNKLYFKHFRSKVWRCLSYLLKALNTYFGIFKCLVFSYLPDVTTFKSVFLDTRTYSSSYLLECWCSKTNTHALILARPLEGLCKKAHLHCAWRGYNQFWRINVHKYMYIHKYLHSEAIIWQTHSFTHIFKFRHYSNIYTSPVPLFYTKA